MDGVRQYSAKSAVFSQINRDKMIRIEHWKLNVYDGVPGELFDLQTDPNEFFNKIEKTEYADTIKLLLSQMENWERSTNDNS